MTESQIETVVYVEMKEICAKLGIEWTALDEFFANERFFIPTSNTSDEFYSLVEGDLK